MDAYTAPRTSTGSPLCHPASLRSLALVVSCLCALGSGFSSRTLGQSSVDVQLAWDRNSETNLSGYTVYYGQSTRSYNRSAYAGTNSALWIRGLEGGYTYYFAVTASSNTGLESDYSGEVTFVAPGPPPNQPPTLDPIANIAIPKNSSPVPVGVSGITSGDGELQVVTVTAEASNPALLINPVVLYSPPYDFATIMVSPKPNATGTARITVTVNDGANRSNLVQRSFIVRIGTPTYQSQYREAESGAVSAPMGLFNDGAASGLAFVSPTQDNTGTARYQITVNQDDDYIVWCRIRSPDAGTDSFFVSVDGGTEDVFDTALALQSSSWQWVQINGRTAGNPRRFSLTRGTHTLTFRSREAYTGLDAFYVTNDPLFVPVKLNLTRVTGTQPGMKVGFQSPAGYRYDIQATYDLKTWTNLWRSTVSTANQQFNYTDPTVSPSGKRFYRLQVVQ